MATDHHSFVNVRVCVCVCVCVLQKAMEDKKSYWQKTMERREIKQVIMEFVADDMQIVVCLTNSLTAYYNYVCQIETLYLQNVGIRYDYLV